MFRKLVFILIIFISLSFINQAVFAYDDQTTHPALTNSAIDFYNLNFYPGQGGAGTKITSEEKGWIIQGSILEDTPPRWVNHFYDPVYNQGWTGFGDLPSGLISPAPPVSAIDWIHNQTLQEKYNFYQGNQTWERAIYEYVHGNEREAFLALGYVLHLLEDMAVPEHSRDDTHMGDSPYENYCTRFTRENFNIVQDLQNQNYQPIVLNSLNNYFEHLADYSNNYFFSKDTIDGSKYDKPKIMKDENGFGYGIDKKGEFLLAKLKIERIDNYNFKKSYFLESSIDYQPILQAYWDRLSREAILSASGTIRLFFEEVAKARENPDLLQPPPESKSAIISFFTGEFSVVGEFFRFNRVWGDIKNLVSEVVSSNPESLTAGAPALLTKTTGNPDTTGDTNYRSSTSIVGPSTPGVDGVSLPLASSAAPESNIVEDISLISDIEFETDTQYTNVAVATNVYSIAAGALIPIPSTPGAGGGAPPAATPELSTDEVNNSVPTLTELMEPESESEETEAPLDTTAPDISFSIVECADSLATDSCLLATTTINLLLSSNADDLNFYEFSVNGAASTTSATSMAIILPDNLTSEISVRAKDLTGNYSEATTSEVKIFTQPVIINEVAWAGTDAPGVGPSDEWLELFNRSPYALNLENWVLSSQTDGKPYINFSGEIQPGGYYLIERTDDDNAVSDIPADWKGSFGNGLDNDGEILILSCASTTIDQTVLTEMGGWPAGNTDKYTMERYDLNNWFSNNGFVTNGKDAAGAPLKGTPRAKNSIVSPVTIAANITKDITLRKANNPVLVDNTLAAVEPGVALKIEPGVVLKFNNNAGFNILGKIMAQGTADEPIVFTSAAEAPAAGDWFGVVIKNGAFDDSVFDHTIFNYAGKYYDGQTQKKALLASDGPAMSVSNSVFEYSKIYGIKLENSASQITNNIFRNNNIGLDLTNSKAMVDSNVFESNTGGAISSFGVLGEFNNNSGSDNTPNAISIWGNLTESGSTYSLKSNPLPYYVSGYENTTVAVSSTLTIEKNVVVKSIDKRIWVEGELVIDGDDPGDIVFTSFVEEPMPGQFAGINVLAGGSLTGRGFTMKYGGSQMNNSWAGIVLNGAIANISNALFDSNKIAFNVSNSTTTLSNIIFQNNLLGVMGDALSSFTASLIEWGEGNTATTSPSGLF